MKTFPGLPAYRSKAVSNTKNAPGNFKDKALSPNFIASVFFNLSHLFGLL